MMPSKLLLRKSSPSPAVSAAEHVENVKLRHAEEVEEAPGELRDFKLAEKRKIIRKVDLRVIFPLGMLLGMSYLDRGNMGNAAIAGMSTDLGLSQGTRYSTMLLVFFPSYVVCQFPFVVAVRKLGPRYLIPASALCWGIVMMCFGFVHNWGAMTGLRFLLGVTEAGLYPGAVWHISMWYTRRDIQLRYSIFAMISMFALAFGGILAYAFSKMEGLANFAAWRWIFIMEGLSTCAVAFLAFLLLVNLPSDAHKAWKFLNKSEAEFMGQLLNEDHRDSEVEESFSLKKFLKPALDAKVWGFGFIYLLGTAVVYAVGYFMPIILRGELKYSYAEAQLLSAPPYGFACIIMYIEGLLGDKFQVRSPFVIFNFILGLIGVCVLAWAPSPGVKYLGIFFVTGGAFANLPAMVTWQTNNIRGYWKRTFCSANIIALGGVGGVFGSLVFRSQDAPRYLPGLYACICCCCVGATVTIVLASYLGTTNNRARNGEILIEGLQNFYYTL